MQSFVPGFTPWHITFGTYGTRLHGGQRPTVDKRHNRRESPFLATDAVREQAARARMKHSGRLLTPEQRAHAEEQMPAICERGGWGCRIAAAGEDHVHLLCDVPIAVHGKTVRRLVKRWLGEELSQVWPPDVGARWWAVGGSNIAVGERDYLENVYWYILRQRFTSAALVGGDRAR